MTVSNEVERMCTEMAMAYFKIPTLHLPLGTKDIQDSRCPGRDSLRALQKYNHRLYSISQLPRPLRKTREQQEEMMKTKEKH
jgi:hypothetical protein